MRGWGALLGEEVLGLLLGSADGKTLKAWKKPCFQRAAVQSPQRRSSGSTYIYIYMYVITGAESCGIWLLPVTGGTRALQNLLVSRFMSFNPCGSRVCVCVCVCVSTPNYNENFPPKQGQELSLKFSCQ